MRSACSPAPGPRGGLWWNIISQAALHHPSWQLLLVLLWRSVGFLLLYTPVLINSKNIALLFIMHVYFYNLHIRPIMASISDDSDKTTCTLHFELQNDGEIGCRSPSNVTLCDNETTDHLSSVRFWPALTMLLSLSSRLPLVTVQLCSSSALSSKGVPPVAMSPSYSFLQFTTKCILVTKHKPQNKTRLITSLHKTL